MCAKEGEKTRKRKCAEQSISSLRQTSCRYLFGASTEFERPRKCEINIEIINVPQLHSCRTVERAGTNVYYPTFTCASLRVRPSSHLLLESLAHFYAAPSPLSSSRGRLTTAAARYAPTAAYVTGERPARASQCRRKQAAEIRRRRSSAVLV